MNTYTECVIATLRDLHTLKAGVPEFVKGGIAADAVLAGAIARLEAHPLNDGDYGGPANAAMSIAMSRSAP